MRERAFQMFDLIYVSESRIRPRDIRRSIDAILRKSRARNERMAITGALLHTGRDFVQILEGERAAVLQVMRDIACDRRHADILILEEREIDRRAYPGWTMAYDGGATFVQERVDRLRAHPKSELAPMRKLLHRFFAANGGVA